MACQSWIEHILFLGSTGGGRTAIDATVRCGIRPEVSFIMGFPEEERGDLNATLSSIAESRLRGACVLANWLAVLPGTRAFEAHHTKLRYDGFSTVSMGHLLSASERELARRLPQIFSSFYFVPVDTCARSTALALTRLSSLLNHFKYTFALLCRQPSAKRHREDLLSLAERWCAAPGFQIIASQQGLDAAAIATMDGVVAKLVAEGRILPFSRDVYRLEREIFLAKQRRWRPLAGAPVAADTRLRTANDWAVFRSSYDPHPALQWLQSGKKSARALPMGDFLTVYRLGEDDRFTLYQLNSNEAAALAAMHSAATVHEALTQARGPVTPQRAGELLHWAVEQGLLAPSVR